MFIGDLVQHSRSKEDADVFFSAGDEGGDEDKRGRLSKKIQETGTTFSAGGGGRRGILQYYYY